jgi:hypothetical protein
MYSLPHPRLSANAFPLPIVPWILQTLSKKLHLSYEQTTVFPLLLQLRFQGLRESSCSLCSAQRFPSRRLLPQMLLYCTNALPAPLTCAFWEYACFSTVLLTGHPQMLSIPRQWSNLLLRLTTTPYTINKSAAFFPSATKHFASSPSGRIVLAVSVQSCPTKQCR